tara:strand:- start:16 stop:426 length:411 start_codon:yes stop_codon:yes gene_type:complete
MGRYYEGDIEGKFWFGIQSSDDADFFGQQGFQPEWLEYYFDEKDLENIQNGLDTCLKELGDKKKLLDNFFEGVEGYTREEVCKVLDVPVPKLSGSIDIHKKSKYHYYMEWYARYELGKKILDRVKSNKFCSFRAEL